jgi:hypothetical protein
MALVPSGVRAVLVPWSVAAVIVSSPSASASSRGVEERSEQPAKALTWACRLIPTDTVRPVVQKGMERSETIRRQCEELAAARAVVVLEWGAMADSQLHARTAMEVRDGVVVARVKLPPLGEIIVLMAHELEHVIEQTRGLDLRAEARRAGSGVWRSVENYYETQAAVDVSRQVAEELRAYSRATRRRRN